MASGSKRVILAALVGNALIAVSKFIAAALTGSSAMLSEGIHSVVDTGNQILLLHGPRRAARPPDQGFPFGHGKEVLSMHMGPEFILLNVSVTFDSAATATDIERAVARLDGGIKTEFPEVKRIFVEAEARAPLAPAAA